MPQVVDGLATLRSKNVTMMVIVQSLAQLDVTYGQDQRKVICDNCDFKAILKATDAETQRYFSQIFGTEEREKVTYTSGEKSSTSRSTEERPRIKPEEFAYLHQELVLLCPRGTGRLQKVPYWQIS